MASQDRLSPDDLKFLQMLEEAPYDADFYAVLRAIECMYSSRPRLGQSLRPADDPIRLGQEVTLGFPSSSIASFAPQSSGSPRRLLVNLLGLLGPNGPMPLHITEYIYERRRHFNDATIESFLDLFHHRILSQFYRAWAESEPTVSLDRPDADRFGRYIASVIGLGLKSLRDRDEMPDWSKLHFSGALSCQTRHPDGLNAILGSFFEAPVAIQEFVGRWITLPVEFVCQLGIPRRAADGNGRGSTVGNSGGSAVGTLHRAPAASPRAAAVASGRSTAVLGRNSTIGHRVWDYQQTFRVVFGPVSFDVFQRMLPGGPGLKRLAAIVRNYVGDELAWELQLILKREEVPQILLGRQGRLGRTTWLHPRRPEKHADDLVLSPGAT